MIAEPLSRTAEASLARLMAFDCTAFPVSSVYLNTEPDGHRRATDPQPWLHREFKALARTFAAPSPELHSFERDAERIIEDAASKIDPAAHGVALLPAAAPADSSRPFS